MQSSQCSRCDESHGLIPILGIEISRAAQPPAANRSPVAAERCGPDPFPVPMPRVVLGQPLTSLHEIPERTGAPAPNSKGHEPPILGALDEPQSEVGVSQPTDPAGVLIGPIVPGMARVE